ncbi:MAG TPA: hypothetical protein VMV29_17630 [Ktedonobacterales bacterium]|nr:hypothetical protein [Ktedonobacterales bacterium]
MRPVLHWRYGRYLSFLGTALYVARRRAAARLAFARWLFATGRMNEFAVRESERESDRESERESEDAASDTNVIPDDDAG